MLIGGTKNNNFQNPKIKKNKFKFKGLKKQDPYLKDKQ